MHRSFHHHLHHHLHEHRSSHWGGVSRRRRNLPDDLDPVIAFLEERQRDLEQVVADLAAKVQRLKAKRDAAAAPSPAPSAGTPAPEPAGSGESA